MITLTALSKKFNVRFNTTPNSLYNYNNDKCVFQLPKSSGETYGILKCIFSKWYIFNSRGNPSYSKFCIFTNCTYNSDETKTIFDLICTNNYGKIDE
ncbi:hypothetical protein PIROE2DRAFT_16964 [Piromyces sp. E2]|nr:hypothetical protein PIROE2DRAFT_16964 [Piromyces sp. E2]|eukprot:OUM57899.1 hypothetical protein PIROE2DRAFT_16964 [Piromyces sp. E2]